MPVGSTPSRRVVDVEREHGHQMLSYDSLVIATGARPVHPPIPGLLHDGVHVLHTMGDGIALRGRLDERPPDDAIVIGSGYIGVELADALARRGIKVTPPSTYRLDRHKHTSEVPHTNRPERDLARGGDGGLRIVSGRMGSRLIEVGFHQPQPSSPADLSERLPLRQLAQQTIAGGQSSLLGAVDETGRRRRPPGSAGVIRRQSTARSRGAVMRGQASAGRGRAARECVEREQPGQPQDGPLRTMETERPRDGRIGHLARWHLDPRRDPPERHGERNPGECVSDDHESVGISRRCTGADRQLSQGATGQCPERRRERPCQLIAGEDACAPFTIDDLAQRRLFDREEWSDIIAARADDPDRRCHQEDDLQRRGNECGPGGEHQACTGDQHPSPTDPVGVRREPERDHRVTEQGEGQEQPDLWRGEAQCRQIEDQDD